MYKVMFEYPNGKKGVCIKDGKPMLFDTLTAAETFANDLNSQISEELRAAFPTWYAVEA